MKAELDCTRQEAQQAASQNAKLKQQLANKVRTSPDDLSGGWPAL